MGGFQIGPVSLKLPKVTPLKFVRMFKISRYSLKKSFIVRAISVAKLSKKIFGEGKFYPPPVKNRVNPIPGGLFEPRFWVGGGGIPPPNT